MSGVGQHLRRRAGQSLEFREHRDYQMGDDIRLVDWRASLRAGERVVRVFEAEEQMTLMILVDARAAMRLPEGAEKLLYSLWSLRALAQVAAGHGDRVVLGTVFSQRDRNPVVAQGRGILPAARRFAEDLWAEDVPPLAEVPVFRPESLLRRLRPASVVILLSDLLFEDADGTMRRFIGKARQSWRQVIVQPLDSLPAELASARREMRLRVTSAEGRSFGDTVFSIDREFEAEVRERIERHVDLQLRSWGGGGLSVAPVVRWPVEASRESLARSFATSFLDSSLLHGVAARGGVT